MVPLRKNALVWAVVTLLVIFGAFYAATTIYKPTKYRTLTYNHFDFVHAGGLWNTQWQKGDIIYNLRLRYNPAQLENISISGYFDPAFNRPNIYVTFDPREGNFTTLSLAAAELSINMIQAIGATPIPACSYNDSTVCDGRPIITCGEANKSVIFLAGTGDGAVAARGECIVLYGEGFEVLKAVDRLLYAWYKIMPVQ
ncbi:hypothetical protein HY641_01900 [Candidatus Woesearchaeota archaeon]|nr:hypothetical protein [Candidatus Woesearchaeota archaeon]